MLRASSADAIKDPYVLGFLNLKDEYSESDFEAALIQRLEDFLLELGSLNHAGVSQMHM